MRFFSITLLLFIATYANTFAQDTVKIRHDAEAMMQATKTNDFKTVVKYIYPPVVKSAGGAHRLIETLTKTVADMKAGNTVIADGEIGKPGEILKIKKRRYSVVPEKLTIVSNGVRVFTYSSLLAISLNNGLDWYFVDAGNMKDEQIKKMFPDIDGKLTIPKRTMPGEQKK